MTPMTHVTSSGYLNQQTDKPMAAAEEMRASSHLKSGAGMEGLALLESICTHFTHRPAVTSVVLTVYVSSVHQHRRTATKLAGLLL